MLKDVEDWVLILPNTTELQKAQIQAWFEMIDCGNSVDYSNIETKRVCKCRTEFRNSFIYAAEQYLVDELLRKLEEENSMKPIINDKMEFTGICHYGEGVRKFAEHVLKEIEGTKQMNIEVKSAISFDPTTGVLTNNLPKMKKTFIVERKGSSLSISGDHPPTSVPTGKSIDFSRYGVYGVDYEIIYK